MVEKIWIGKKVKVVLKKDGRYYKGLVVDEDHLGITIRDIVGKLVFFHRDELSVLEEVKHE